MFDASVPDVEDLRAVGNDDLICGIIGWSRSASVAHARQYARIAEWHRRSLAHEVAPNGAADDWDNAVAQVSAALTIGMGRASTMVDTALALRDRFPKLGSLFLAGEVSERVMSRFVWLTTLVTDPAALAALDAAVADAGAGWGVLSGDKLDTAINVWIDRYDPDAVRRVRTRVRGRDLRIGKPDDTTGTTSVYGALSTPDAALLAARRDAMVRSVCPDDPRTIAQRRADALGAIAAGAFTLACRCANPDCPVAGIDDGRASSFTVHVITDQSALTATPDPSMDGDDAADDESPAEAEKVPEPRREEVPVPQPTPTTPTPAAGRGTALIPSLRGAILPTPLLADLIAHGAKVRFVGTPESIPEDRYRPSAALDRFLRTRDLTCRHPGCNTPAVAADIDHTIPYPDGPTHPANTKAYCRKFHLIKTFWAGWSETQDPDGTLHITTPTGHTYTTKPLATLLFPTWNTTTEPPPPHRIHTPPPPAPDRHLTMPTRRHTRTQTRQYRITQERRLNALQRERELAAKLKAAAIRKAKHQTPQTHSPPAVYPDYQPDNGDDPPPF